ncbi:hypothetical protein MPPM_5222 [Methylorubrum populi]|uniref:Uncharacterized protein n=1 Tax=Methylorubrum populi TaxID=223967 RepID=A0A160PJP9_9HYPH|nr:hypothetical protein MPPM_5222 [Methylorubrum populi]
MGRLIPGTERCKSRASGTKLLLKRENFRQMADAGQTKISRACALAHKIGSWSASAEEPATKSGQPLFLRFGAALRRKNLSWRRDSAHLLGGRRPQRDELGHSQ